MKAFIEILREKYGLAQPEAEKLLEQMELLTYRKGEHIVREGERNSSFYLVADGIWRGHYLRDYRRHQRFVRPHVFRYG